MGKIADATRAVRLELWRDLRILGIIVGALWAVLLVNTIVLGGQLNSFGILPRTGVGLRGIAFSPFLHAGFGHLFGNTIGLVLLGGLVLLREEADFWIVTIVGIVVGGVGTWLFGRPSLHIGASGVVFAYFGYLACTGWFERRVVSILLSLAAIVLWSGLFFGILPGQPGISWEGHLFGFGGGGLAAWLLSRQRKRSRTRGLAPS